jgi:hypothetical protein
MGRFGVALQALRVPTTAFSERDRQDCKPKQFTRAPMGDVMQRPRDQPTSDHKHNDSEGDQFRHCNSQRALQIVGFKEAGDAM